MKTKQEEDKSNYSFLLNCMGALAASAIIAAGVITAYALKASSAIAAGFAAKAAFAASASLAVVFPFLIPVIAVALVVGVICLFPFMFSRNTYAVNSNPGFFSGPIYTSGYYPGDRYYHGVYEPRVYQSYPSGPIHGHPSAVVVHGHGNPSQSSSGPVHGHR